MSDEPIIPRIDSQPFSCEVINLEAVRIEYGLPKARNNCQHRSMVYCSSERRVWCKDCETTVDSFDAFMVLTKNFYRMLKEIKRMNCAAKEALEHTVRLRATKNLDKAWGRKNTVPGCPHCKEALLPDDFADGIIYQRSRELEMARRKKGKNK